VSIPDLIQSPPGTVPIAATTNPERRPTNVGVDWKLAILYTKSHVVISHHRQCTASVVPKTVAMATSLRPSISAMSSVDSLTPKTHPLESNCESLAALQPKLYTLKVYLPHPIPQGNSRSQRWVGPLYIWYGRPHLAADWSYYFRFPDFPALGNGGLKVSILGPRIAENWGFSPPLVFGGTYEHPYRR